MKQWYVYRDEDVFEVDSILELEPTEVAHINATLDMLRQKYGDVLALEGITLEPLRPSGMTWDDITNYLEEVAKEGESELKKVKKWEKI